MKTCGTGVDNAREYAFFPNYLAIPLIKPILQLFEVLSSDLSVSPQGFSSKTSLLSNVGQRNGCVSLCT